ncbi:hypothetical protein AXF42_Ash002018 [Apostasia shenzhenica]|uniref:Uncharacterized protein n=1 Tax=Apostasia shenzhenica TaxID=1088818 RepID=A0A2I0ABX4_9ASPA|nr:hypothetical protein AXF42_Ash002018 [Apostasia shenzhenica]
MTKRFDIFASVDAPSAAKHRQASSSRANCGRNQGVERRGICHGSARDNGNGTAAV